MFISHSFRPPIINFLYDFSFEWNRIVRLILWIRINMKRNICIIAIIEFPSVFSIYNTLTNILDRI